MKQTGGPLREVRSCVLHSEVRQGSARAAIGTLELVCGHTVRHWLGTMRERPADLIAKAPKRKRCATCVAFR